jgi:hypothetical protein
VIAELETLLDELAAAVAAHPALVAAERIPGAGAEPELRVARGGGDVAWTALVTVRRVKSRKRASQIHAYGPTPAAAVAALAESLDYWAEAIR